MVDERDVEKWLRIQIEKMGGLFLKWVSPGNAGVPDRIAVLPFGRVYFVELKKDGETSKPLQRYQQGRLEHIGCTVREVVGMKGARKFMEELENDIQTT